MNTSSTCQEFYERIWNDPAVKLHSMCVIECCTNSIVNTDLDSEVFIIAGWIHDLGRKESVAEHNILSLKYLDMFLSENPELAGKKEMIADCILNHRKDANPKTIYGKIFQVADKVALHNKKWITSGLKFA